MQVVGTNLHVGHAGVVPHIKGTPIDSDVGSVSLDAIGGSNVDVTVVIIDVVIIVASYKRRDVSLCLVLCAFEILPRDGEQTVVAAAAAKTLTSQLAT